MPGGLWQDAGTGKPRLAGLWVWLQALDLKGADQHGRVGAGNEPGAMRDLHSRQVTGRARDRKRLHEFVAEILRLRDKGIGATQTRTCSV